VSKAGEETLSVECTLAKQPGYAMVHDQCRQTRDIPLPHSFGVMLIKRCTCKCHKEGTR
jgi:hypothetical protein